MKRELALTEDGLLICNLGTIEPGGQGRILECTLKLSGVLPERRVAVAVTVSRQDSQGLEHPRGLRTAVIPAHHGTAPQDIAVPPLRFILPDGLDGEDGELRQITIRADAHYIDQGGCCVLPGPAGQEPRE